MQSNVLFMLAVFSCAAASADEVYLKGGGRVSGRIVQRTATSVEIDVGGGTVTVPAKQVERIVEARGALDAYSDRAGALDPKDREGWAALGRWASDQGLSTQSREAYRRVLAIDPSDAEANQALGNVLVNGRCRAQTDTGPVDDAACPPADVFECERLHGSTLFDIEPGPTELWIRPLCAGGAVAAQIVDAKVMPVFPTGPTQLQRVAHDGEIGDGARIDSAAGLPFRGRRAIEIEIQRGSQL